MLPTKGRIWSDMQANRVRQQMVHLSSDLIPAEELVWEMNTVQSQHMPLDEKTPPRRWDREWTSIK